MAHISFTAVLNNGNIGQGIGGIRKSTKKNYIYLFLTCCVTCVTKKENQNRGPQMNSPTLPQKNSNFSQLHLFLFVGPAKPLWSLALVQLLTMAYKYRCLVLNCKTPRRSLRQLDETHRRIKKFYNYCSQSAAHQFSFKDIV